MADNLWDDEENFSDMPEEAQTSNDGKPVIPSNEPVYAPPSRAPIPRTAPPKKQPEPEYEEVLDQIAEEDFSDVLTDANLRLEQGNLWRMIINHSLFEGVEADPRAVQGVQAEIRKFARERMEIMLGMKRETESVERLEIDFPFNALEVEVLKKLAFTATKGATENSDRYVPEVNRVTEEVPRRTGLNTITSKRSAPAPAPAPVKKPLQSKPAAPVKRSKLDVTIDQICREEGVPRELLEENHKPLSVPATQLSDEELLARNAEAAKRRGGRVPSQSALPMPTPEQTEAMAIAQAARLGSGTGMSRIIDAVKKMPINNP